MSRHRHFPFEKIAVLAAAVLAFASAAVWLRRPIDVERAPAASGPAAESLAAVPDFAPPPEPQAHPPPGWPRPGPQAAGPDWIYELFTPPAVFFDPAGRRFITTRPKAVAPVASVPERASAGIAVVAVWREPFPLQLAGYFGGPVDWLAAFTRAGRPEPVLARPGWRFESLGLNFRRLEFRRAGRGNPAGGAAPEADACAVLFDERTGEEVELDLREPKLTDTPVALLRFGAAGSGFLREVRAGDAVEAGAVAYRVERIELDPPAVVLAKRAPGIPATETLVLRPASRPVAARADPPSPPPRPIARHP